MTLPIFTDLKGAKVTWKTRALRRALFLTARPVSLLMALLARFGRQSLVDPSGPVVTLTSYGPRILKVGRSIESIGRGSVRPARIILWLDDEAAFASLPRSLDRQTKRGLEVRLADNLGPHTKYYPLLEDDEGYSGEFVTADDDIIYPRSWLRDLVKTARENPNQIVCHRTHWITFCEGAIAPYAEWTSPPSGEPDPRVFPTGVSGALYPEVMTRALIIAGRKFVTSTPQNDDIWLHWVALHNSIPVRQVSSVPKHFWITPHTQSGSLMSSNHTGPNDVAVSRLYGPHELTLLNASPS